MSLDREARLRLDEAVNRRLTPAEVAAYLSGPVSDAERKEVFALVRWFRRRYPTGAERLAYVRRAYRRWAGLATGSPTAIDFCSSTVRGVTPLRSASARSSAAANSPTEAKRWAGVLASARRTASATAGGTGPAGDDRGADRAPDGR